MSAKPRLAPIALGFRALKGGSVVVGVAIDKGAPRIVLSSFLATAADGDRLSLEPYHVAVGMKPGPDGKPSAAAKAAVAKGRRRQDELATAGLKDILSRLRKQGNEPAVAALLVNRAGWATDLLAYSFAFADHPPVAEGLAVREALRFGFGQVGLKVVETDEKSLSDLAEKQLGLSPSGIDGRLKALGATAGRPWRKEQKLAALGAWVAVVSKP